MKRVKEIAKEIKTELQKINGVKLSTSSKNGHLYVSLMAAPFEVITNGKDNLDVNQYYFQTDDRLTTDAKIIFSLIEEIVKKYHWDKSDSMTDYFNCAFYYSYEVGQWNKPFVKK